MNRHLLSSHSVPGEQTGDRSNRQDTRHKTPEEPEEGTKMPREEDSGWVLLVGSEPGDKQREGAEFRQREIHA